MRIEMEVSGATISVKIEPYRSVTAMDVLALAQLQAAPGVYQLEPAQTDEPLTEPMTVWEGDDEPPIDEGRRLWAIVKGPNEAEQRRKLLAADRRLAARRERQHEEAAV